MAVALADDDSPALHAADTVAAGTGLVDPAIAERARLAVQRMVDLPPPAIPARYDLVKARHHVDVELI